MKFILRPLVRCVQPTMRGGAPGRDGTLTTGPGWMADHGSWLYHCQSPQYVQLKKYGFKKLNVLKLA